MLFKLEDSDEKKDGPAKAPIESKKPVQYSSSESVAIPKADRKLSNAKKTTNARSVPVMAYSVKTGLEMEKKSVWGKFPVGNEESSSSDSSDDQEDNVANMNIQHSY
ncbi:MAG: hypothetical protein M3R00_09130 [Pseudomonadota bacterium]|nr:hypothetical protein [Pseudomonadota bacterium]